MAEKRKVANLMGLAVLATVVQRPMHRYEMASVMRARGKDRDMDIKWGSLYTVVQNLERNGYLETIGVTRQGARPERTVYQITEAGRAELIAWTRELIAEPASDVPRLFLIEDEYRIAMTRAEADWVRSLLDELTAGTFPHLDAWRSFHETGQMPPEFADLEK
jgi:DNA-binding PadR family transcriptional regulator